MKKRNMQILKKSRKEVCQGDIFVFKLKKENVFRFGRVIKVNVKIGGIDNLILIYLYKASSESKNDIPLLNPDELLIPPLATEKTPWTSGYFETVESRPLTSEDVLPFHHFKGYKDRFFDDEGAPVSSPKEPIGIWGLHSVGAIDNEISDALGIPWAEEPSEDLLRALEGKPNLHRQRQ